MSFLFVTGMPRSGTTLLDKCLSMCAGVDVLSQPLPLLYVELKRQFRESCERPEASPVSDAFPINDMFGDHFYSPAALVDFLGAYLLNPQMGRRVLEKMLDFDGQYTKPDGPLDAYCVRLPCQLEEFVHDYIAQVSECGDAAVLGAKETWCEEFIPYYLKRGVRVILIVRDPRDVVTSLNFGFASRHSGLPKPDLFTIRQWRKSVAFAIQFVANERLRVLRFEDLVSNPSAEIERLLEWLGVPQPLPFDPDGGLRDRRGQEWISNSSIEPNTRIDTQAIGRHRQLLSTRRREFIEALCLPEMLALGYEPEVNPSQVYRIMADYGGEPVSARLELRDYRWSELRHSEERHRWELIRECRFEPAALIFEGAARHLSAAVGASG